MLKFLENVLQSRSVEEVWAHLTAKMMEYGFDRLIYAYTRLMTRSGFGDIQDILLLTTQSPEYMEGFIAGGRYNNAPMTNWARRNVGSCSWRWIEENYDRLTREEKEVVEFNRNMGVTAGYTIAFPEISTRSKGAIALTARKGIRQHEVDELWQRKGREIEVLNHVAHLALTTLPQLQARRALTRRQREVLQWVGDGKTVQDIALLMGLTPATVEKHLRLARRALNAETTAQAVLKASVIHQIYVLDPVSDDNGNG